MTCRYGPYLRSAGNPSSLFALRQIGKGAKLIASSHHARARDAMGLVATLAHLRRIEPCEHRVETPVGQAQRIRVPLVRLLAPDSKPIQEPVKCAA